MLCEALKSVLSAHLLLDYRVTHQVEPNLPLTPKQKSRLGLASPRQARPKQNFVLMSTGGLAQPDVSPCMLG